MRCLMDMLLSKQRPVMLVGAAGTGKTILAHAAMKALENECNVASVPFNYYTTAAMLQGLYGQVEEKLLRAPVHV